jgi:hypothetical protein
LVLLAVLVVLAIVAGMDAAGAELGVETVAAVLVVIADIIEWSEFGAVRGLLGELDGLVHVEALLAINEVRGNF